MLAQSCQIERLALTPQEMGEAASTAAAKITSPMFVQSLLEKSHSRSNISHSFMPPSP